MSKLTQIIDELEELGNEQYKRIFLNHGAPDSLFGVKIEDLKKIVKREKKNHALALELYDTGNSDAMYLAGLLADEKKMTPDDLRRWVQSATWYMLSQYTVAWVAAETPYGWELGLEWIESPEEMTAVAGWSTLASWVTIRPDAELDLDALRALLDRVGASIRQAPNRVRYVMNGFVIAVGISVAPLTDHALRTARQVGKVSVNMGNTECKVPDAETYIENARAKGKIGYKKKMARC
jgi:hypothetical protein